MTPDELKALFLDNPDLLWELVQADPRLRTIVAAGVIATKREAARKLLEYVRGRSAAKLATYDDQMSPILTARQSAEDSHRQMLAQLDAAVTDLTNDRDASLPTRPQIDAAIVGWRE